MKRVSLWSTAIKRSIDKLASLVIYVYFFFRSWMYCSIFCASSTSNVAAVSRQSSEHLNTSSSNDLLGCSISNVSGFRLNGSVVSESRCDFIVDMSTVTPDVGKITGFFIMVAINGSNKRCRAYVKHSALNHVNF